MTLLLASILLQTSGGTQDLRDYPLQPTFSYDEADRVTALAIVEPVAPGQESRRLYENGKPAPDVAATYSVRTRTETVRIVDSTAFAPRTVVKVTVAGTPSLAPGYPMLAGHRYLVLASLPRGNRLETPHSGLFGTGTDTAYALSSEVSGLMAFETHAGRLDASPKIADRIANSVVDCVPGSEAANVHRVAMWLMSSQYPGAGPYRSADGQEPFTLARRLRSLAIGKPAYVRYELFEALCRWGVYGSEQGLVDAVVDLAGEKDPFLPGDFLLSSDLTFSIGRTVRDQSYVPVRLDANRWADVIVSAQNDAVRGILLNQVDRIPDEAHLRKLAQTLLDSPSLEESAIGYFSRVLKRPDLAPQHENVAGRSAWVNRDAALKSLRTHYGLTTPLEGNSPGARS